MGRRQELIQKIQTLSAQERARQPAPEDWLWTQDKAGRENVDASDARDLAIWATALQTTPEALRAALSVVGTSADAIRDYLRT